MSSDSINNFFVTCSKGVEDILQKELELLNISGIKIQTGGVSFSGELKLAYAACLWSRVASRVLLQLKEFTIHSDDDLYNEIDSIDWSEHFAEDNTLAIDCFSSHDEVNNSHFATLRVKDAIVDQFMKKTEQRPSIDREQPDIRINVYLSNKQCMAYLDLSGEALHKRGYRVSVGSAPLRETLAASMLYRAKWNTYYEQGLPFYDPMCGSGTLLIEAAMMAANIAPGLLRETFGFIHWKQFVSDDWGNVLADAEDKRKKGLNSLPKITGSESDEILVGISRKNIEAAGLSDAIKVFLQDATENLTPYTEKKGLIVTNPPYGKRIGQVQLLRTLYYRFGIQLKANFNGWIAVVITSEQELARSLGLRAFRKNTLFNGALTATLYQYRIDALTKKKLQSTDKLIDGQAGLSSDKQVGTSVQEQAETSVIATDHVSEHALMFKNRLKKNYKHLKKWARKNNINCYRVYDADIPQYAVAIDVYDRWVHVQEYKAPKTVNKNKAFQRINDVIDVVADVLETTQKHVVLKVRKKQEGASQYQKQDRKNYTNIVEENGLKFIINMYDYIDTGLFLDHRNTRQLIKKLAHKKSFLNLFAYTGSVSVYAAAGGASSITTVDMSNTYLQWAQENMTLNGFSEGPYTKDKYTFIREDCLKWLNQAIAGNIEKKQEYQLIFVDPPTFSNSKKMTTSLDINRDHVALLSGCLALLADNGKIIFSTNAKGFKIDNSLSELCYLKEITLLTTTEDYRRKPIHRCWCLAKQESALDLQL
jgi:23S rRNA (guanine2445-N2)-methyltransferase / 23S rRNA (guanine2069-N7)-methyltransferase